MAKKKTKFKSYDEAVEAQKEAKTAIKEAKKDLTTYYKENKLKRSGDYSDDKKHGKKIGVLERKVESAQNKLADINAYMKENKPSKERKTKYDYPEDVVTADDRKKYRQKMRAEAAAKDKPKKEKASTSKSKTKKAAGKSKTTTKKKKKTTKKASSNKDD